MTYDLIIIGSGPAGLSAAIYGERAKLSNIMIEKSGFSGGQVLTTYEVDNYPGLPGISGIDLSMKMREHADKLGANFIAAEVTEIVNEGKIKRVITDQGEYQSKAVILATGASYAKLDIEGEEKLKGMGVSYCATCDGAFFRNKTVAVVGGGDVAVEDAIFLARFCEKVYLVHRRAQLRAAMVLQEALFSLPNVEILWDRVATRIIGDEQVEGILIQNVKDKSETQISLQGVFIAVGINPNSESFQTTVACDTQGYIMANESCQTNIDGIFAAGDVRTKQLRQIVTAISDGANAITSAQNYFNQYKDV